MSKQLETVCPGCSILQFITMYSSLAGSCQMNCWRVVGDVVLCNQQYNENIRISPPITKYTFQPTHYKIYVSAHPLKIYVSAHPLQNIRFSPPVTKYTYQPTHYKIYVSAHPLQNIRISPPLIKYTYQPINFKIYVSAHPL
jgi:hypothetical protein